MKSLFTVSEAAKCGGCLRSDRPVYCVAESETKATRLHAEGKSGLCADCLVEMLIDRQAQIRIPSAPQAAKIYRGRRLGPAETLPPVEVTVDQGGKTRPLQHRVYHSPTGFEWGYPGSGPADLARSILWDCLGKGRALRLYMFFKDDFVARWGQQWQITSQEIEDWASQTEAEFGFGWPNKTKPKPTSALREI